MLCKNDAPLLIVFGQSNAHGHATKLLPEEKIQQPLKNVYGLSREYNQAYGLSKLIWTGYTSFGMNLGETQDHTCCLATEFARMWQKSIDGGKELPDLYVVQISIGAQGIAKVEGNGWNMWYPHRAKVMKPGDLAHVNISLYPLAIEVLQLLKPCFEQMGKHPVVLGLHWNQWETEAMTGGKAIEDAKENYDELFSGFRNAIGLPCPIFLYKPLADVYENPPAVQNLTRLFEEYEKKGENYHLIDLSQTEMFCPEQKDKGIFVDDCVHYRKQVHRWFAQQMYEFAFKDKKKLNTIK